MIAAGIHFALLSFLFAGVNDLVFKRYAVAARSTGMLLLGIGLVWTTIQLVVFTILGKTIRFDAATVLYGGGAGVLLVGSNILLIESFGHVELSLGSTIYRLNTIAVAALSYLVLGERLGTAKMAGIGLGVVAVLLLTHRPAWRTHYPRHALFVAGVVVAALLRATYGVLTRKAMLAHVGAEPLLLLVSASWIVGGAIYAFSRDDRVVFGRHEATYSLLSGTLVFLIVYFLMRAVERGQASIVIPIANMSFLVALSASIATGMEALTTRKGMAACLAVGAILLLAQA